jgi:hypothetical protein
MQRAKQAPNHTACWAQSPSRATESFPRENLLQEGSRVSVLFFVLAMSQVFLFR